MITNGEKYACESCIRGHRVAQCQHTDRPLQRVGKKGRPVSQCNHCRSLRTSRSVHTKCKCGSTSRQATLKQFGQERCLCCEGGDCTCAYKTGQKHCGSSSSTSSPSANSNQRSPEMALSPDLSNATSIPHDIADIHGTYSPSSFVSLDDRSPEPVRDARMPPPDNGPHPEIPQTPDWLGSLDSVLGPIPDDQVQFSMPALNDPLSMDPSYLIDIWSHLPQPEQPNNPDPFPTFDTDLTFYSFDGQGNYQEGLTTDYEPASQPSTEQMVNEGRA